MPSFEYIVCSLQSQLFWGAVSEGYDFVDFTNKYMRSKTAGRMDHEWSHLHSMSPFYILEELEDEFTILPKKNDDDGEAFVKWAGWLYRYWHYYTGESSASIVEQASPELLQRMYYAYHCLDWKDTIDAIKEINKSKE